MRNQSFLMFRVWISFAIIGMVAVQGFRLFDTRSSKSNAEIAIRNYPNNSILRLVMLSAGDELPIMRDDIIRRRNNGEGPLESILHAYLIWSNWIPDFGNNRKERADPYRFRQWFSRNRTARVRPVPRNSPL